MKCDIPAGTYNLKGYAPDTSSVPPVLSSGDYMIDGKLFRSDEFLQSFQAQFYIINKKGGLNGLN